MIKEILYKWFGLEPFPCPTCEVLRNQLLGNERERRELLARLLEKGQPEPSVPTVKEEELKAITPQFIPWRVKQQMLESEDRRSAQLMREKTNEIEKLEKELGVQ